MNRSLFCRLRVFRCTPLTIAKWSKVPASRKAWITLHPVIPRGCILVSRRLLNAYDFLPGPLKLASRPKKAAPFVLPGLTRVATALCRTLMRRMLIVARLLNRCPMRLIIRTGLGPDIFGLRVMLLKVLTRRCRLLGTEV